ncbi:MAG: family 20 glycosylhydrolase [Oscillospiraceae bacterium]|nr:family 20 glycosylhydrolase [Oscillospiraceae bacterium]
MTQISFAQPKRYEQAGGGAWKAPNIDGRIIFAAGDAPWENIAACVNVLGEEYPRLAAAPQLRDVEPLDGDLVIRVGEPEELRGVETYREGYVIHAGPVMVLTAQSERAVLYGLRTILEAMEDGGLAYGVIVDYPHTREREFHLDAGRKYYTKDWILDLVRTLSRNRMNVLWLHFSENEGFRIASDRHPELPSLHHLSKEEVREVIRVCGAYHIDINPSLDCPGHLGQVLQEHPRWRLDREGTEPLWSALDITKEDARAFLFDLIDEYAELFAGSKVFHIGGDEFIDFNHFEMFPAMTAYARERLGPGCGGVDVYVDFLNQVIAHVRAKGFRVRVWNDGLFRPDLEEHVQLDKDVQIAFWSNWDKGMAPLKTFLERGYQVVNYHSDYLYYILLIRKDYKDPDPEKLLSEWNPSVFPTHPLQGKQVIPAEYAGQFLGSCYSIWSDWPDLQTEEEVMARCRDSLRAFGVRCWSWKDDADSRA